MKLRLGLGLSSPSGNRDKAPKDILLSSSSIPENNSPDDVVGELSAVDPSDEGPWAFELVAGAGSDDNESFSISGSDLRIGVVADFEEKETCSVRVQVTNSKGLSLQKALVIDVEDVNDPPTDIVLSATSIIENNSINAVIGTFSTVDPDAVDSFTYTLVSGTGSTDNGSFNILGNALRASIAFNYESKSSYSIRVRSTDSGSLTTEKQFTITITDVNEAPTNITLSNASVPEDLAVGMAVGTLSTTDPDAGETFTHSIASDPDSKFAIRGNELITRAGLDYETKTSHSVTIQVTDKGGAGLTFSKAFTITVTNVSDESTTPPLDPSGVTPVFSGNFDVNPAVNKGNGKAKVQGKATSQAAIVLSIGALTAGAQWAAQVDPDFSLLSNGGKDAMVGFGLKNGNDFHLVGIKGNGSTGLTNAKIYGNWSGLNGATISTGSAPTNGTQAGPNWIKIAVSVDGSTYTFYTGTGASIDAVTWTAEYSAQTPTPLSTAATATNFGIAIFLPSTDTGQFSLEISVWSPLWTPANLTVPPQAWYDFSQIGGSNGDKVTPTDRSGHGNNLSPIINSNNRAALEVAGLNGRNVLDFDYDLSPTGTKAYVLPNIYSGKSSGAAFAVLRAALDPPSDQLKAGLWKFGTGGNNNQDAYPFTNGGVYMGWGTTTRWCANDNFAQDLSQWHILNAHAASNNAKIFVNDIQENTTSSVTVGFHSAPVIGQSDTSVAGQPSFDGKAAEFIFLDYVPTTTERNKIAGYLAHKWGLASLLDSGHPYKNAPPMA